jgi:hypothetical protein
MVPEDTLEIGFREDAVFWLTASREVSTAEDAERYMGGAWRVVAEVLLAPGDWLDSKSREWHECEPGEPEARAGWRLVNPVPEQVLDEYDELVPNPHHDPEYVALRFANRPLYLGSALVLSLDEVAELRAALPADWEPDSVYISLERGVEPEDPFDAYHLFDMDLRDALEEALGADFGQFGPGYRMIRVALDRILEVHPTLIADLLRESVPRWRQAVPRIYDLPPKRRTMPEESFSFDSSNTADDGERRDPTYRATIRRGRVMITYWAAWLAAGGAWNWMLDARARAGVAIADLTLTGDDESEVLVTYLSAGRSRDEADEALRSWAESLGYRRIWFPDRVVELDADPPVGHRAEVRCPTCGSRWHDSTPDFWEMVRDQGSFPKWCIVCGWELPQWEVSE